MEKEESKEFQSSKSLSNQIKLSNIQNFSFGPVQ